MSKWNPREGACMNVQERIRVCRLLEKMELQEECCIRLKLENHTTFHGKNVKEYDVKDGK